MPVHFRGPAAALVASSVLLGGPGLAHAAANPPDAGQPLNETGRTPPIAPPTKPRVEGEPATPARPGGGGATVQVTGWRFKGNTLFSGDQLDALIADTVGPSLDMAGLGAAAARITAAYRAAGYPLAQALLPPQQINGGVIELAIVEGRIESTALDGASTGRLAPALTADLLRRVPTGEVARDESINRLALIANELPGISARVVLQPGQEAGGTALLLKLEQARRWAATVFADNQGAYATGRNRVGASGSWFNAAGRGDSLDVSVVTTSGHQTFGSLDYGLAVSGAGDRVGFGLSHLSYALGGVYDGQGSGTADTIGLNYRYPVVRTPVANLTLVAKAERRKLRDHSTAAENNRHADVLSAGVLAAGADADGTTTGYAHLIGGRIGFDDAAAEALDQAATGPQLKGGFHKLSFGVNRMQRVGGEVSLFGSLTGQLSGQHRLDSSERFSLGGASAVRAYPIGETTGDAGYVVTAELRHAPAALPDAQFALFYDAGKVTRHANIDPATDTPAKRGYGVAANYAGPWFELRGSLAWRSTGRSAVDPAAHGQQFYVQFSTSF